MNNIKFNYLYRDAGNYKVFGSVTYKNSTNLSLTIVEQKLREKLIDSEFFDPTEFGVPRLINRDFLFDPELDHSWHEFESIELSDNDECILDIEELINKKL